jgi:hypothetical protein
MKGIVFLCLVAAVGAANLRTYREPAEVGKTVGAALTTIEKALAKNKDRQSQTASLCAKEQAETKKWLDEGSGIDNKDRNAAKRGLADALAGRIAGLKKFLGKLKNIRKRLRTHIIRVNSAFGTKYLENQNAMEAAKSAMDPQAGLKLLKLPAQDVETEEDKAEMAEDDKDPDNKATPAAFLELLEPSKIGDLSTKLYETALANSKATRQAIEKERSTLGEFRDKLRALILKREAKLKKLEKQLADINKALADGGSFMKDIWPYLKKHYDVTASSCKMMDASFLTAEKAEQEVVDAIKSGASGGADPQAPVVADEAPKPITF